MNKGRNFRKNLIAFGAVLRNERNHLAIQQLMELNLSSDAFKELVKSRKQIENTFNVLVEKVRQKIDSLDPSSLPGGKTTMKGIQSISSHSEFPIEPVLIKPKLSENLEKSSEKGVISEDLKEAIVELEDFQALLIMRERTPITKTLIESLPKLKYVMTSGMRNKSIDLEA